MEFGVFVHLRKFFHGMNGVGGLLPLVFDVRYFPSGSAFQGQLQHKKSILGRRPLRFPFICMDIGRDKENLIGRKRPFHGFSYGNMSVMDRIEASSDHCN
jgi:hypothetical protein